MLKNRFTLFLPTVDKYVHFLSDGKIPPESNIYYLSFFYYLLSHLSHNIKEAKFELLKLNHIIFDTKNYIFNAKDI